MDEEKVIKKTYVCMPTEEPDKMRCDIYVNGKIEKTLFVSKDKLSDITKEVEKE